jgi:biotin operon repressor
MTVTNEQKMLFVTKRAQSMSFDKIAQELGISKNTLLKLQGELYDQIREQEFYEVQELTEQFRVTRRDRFEVTARLLGAVRDELARRANAEQLTDLPLDKLVNLALILEKRLSQDTGRELVSVQTGDDWSKIIGGYKFIDAD